MMYYDVSWTHVEPMMKLVGDQFDPTLQETDIVFGQSPTNIDHFQGKFINFHMPGTCFGHQTWQWKISLRKLSPLNLYTVWQHSQHEHGHRSFGELSHKKNGDVQWLW